LTETYFTDLANNCICPFSSGEDLQTRNSREDVPYLRPTITSKKNEIIYDNLDYKFPFKS
jgi:hypothetical protein